MKSIIALSGAFIGAGLTMICTQIFILSQSPSWNGFALLVAGLATLVTFKIN